MQTETCSDAARLGWAGLGWAELGWAGAGHNKEIKKTKLLPGRRGALRRRIGGSQPQHFWFKVGFCHLLC